MHCNSFRHPGGVPEGSRPEGAATGHHDACRVLRGIRRYALGSGARLAALLVHDARAALPEGDRTTAGDVDGLKRGLRRRRTDRSGEANEWDGRHRLIPRRTRHEETLGHPRRRNCRFGGACSRRVAQATGSSTQAADPHAAHAKSVRLQGLTQSDLRALLGRQLGEHAALAMNATNLGVTGSQHSRQQQGRWTGTRSRCRSRSPPVYGKKAGNAFLNGKFQWRDHISVLRRLHRRDGEEEQGGPEQGGREPQALHRRARQAPRRRDRAAREGGPERPPGPRARAQGPARHVCRQEIRAGGDALSEPLTHTCS